MSHASFSRHRQGRHVALAFLLAAFGGAAPACELDGLAHGYGPVSALFAGMHRSPALDGREDKPPPELPPLEVAPAATAAAPAEAPAAEPPASVPAARPAAARPRSFAPWVKARPAADELAKPALPAPAPKPAAAPTLPEGRPAAS
jgi:hypothetical protein